jgi:hypothetical protein
MNFLKGMLGAAVTPEVINAIKGAAGSGMLGMLPQKLAESQAASSDASSAVNAALADNLQAKMLKQRAEQAALAGEEPSGMKRGGKVKKYAKGGSVSSASKRADGCATKGKTKGRFV